MQIFSSFEPDDKGNIYITETIYFSISIWKRVEVEWQRK